MELAVVALAYAFNNKINTKPTLYGVEGSDDSKQFMAELTSRRNEILKEDVETEIREFTGSISSIVVDINSYVVQGWPLFWSADGDPNADVNSGTPPYIIGLIYNDAKYFEMVKQFADDKKFTYYFDTGKIPMREKSHVSISTEPLKDITINNFFQFGVMQLGERKLELKPEEVIKLKQIVKDHYAVVIIEDWNQKVNDLWGDINKMLQGISKNP